MFDQPNQIEITDKILIFLLDNKADQENTYVMHEALTSFLAQQYGLGIVPPYLLNSSMALLASSLLIEVNKNGIQLRDKFEAQHVKDRPTEDDGGPTYRQEVMSVLPEIRVESDISLYLYFLIFYIDICGRNTVRGIASKDVVIDALKANHLIRKRLLKEAYEWRNFKDKLLKTNLYKKSSFRGLRVENAPINFYDKVIFNLYHLSNRICLPEFHDQQKGKELISLIASFKDFPLDEIISGKEA